MKRSQFLKTLGTSGFVIAGTSLMSFSAPQTNDPQLDKEMVATFVGAGHGRFDVVKSLLEEHPTLLNAAHDWKFGDFETALGAASHVGNKEIAQYLINKGAQVNIFTAALFGKMEIVKPMLTAFPESLNAKGPHGFTLLHHAIKGGEDAIEVKEYLESLGAVETKIELY
ncbi:ankyrin repeat domain-containing protein [Constantimarinum furrinae]|uniref:Ankyrin repeat domain protein n=1 Tax=Constantimarinum furrinae TaxID=2562285 RepID=A0A7G8PVZ0_9FLAO|nr:ankyrin repeat domain-containing protein [Constantimarinum furrinae]QNJ98506.1 Ankyrin repeat domain protein [Constantimarinum furrinae]